MFEFITEAVTRYGVMVHRMLDHDVYRLTMIASILISVGAFEFKFPAERGQDAIGRIKNVCFNTTYILLGILAIAALSIAFPFKAPIRQSGGWFNSAVVCVYYLIAFDFLYYWLHRAHHHIKVLWAMHEIHHSDDQVNVTTSMRSFWFEVPLQYLLVSRTVLAIIGIDRGAMLVLPFIMTGWQMFIHANLRLNLGPLTPIFNGPQFHRIHHSSEAQHFNKNFSIFFPIWDIIFRTYHAPAADEYPATGTNSLAPNISIKKIVVGPFLVWNEMVRKLLVPKKTGERLNPLSNASHPQVLAQKN